MTRKRFVKLYRALNARLLMPNMNRYIPDFRIMPGSDKTYAWAWRQLSFYAAMTGVGEKTKGKPAPVGILAGDPENRGTPIRGLHGR